MEKFTYKLEDMLQEKLSLFKQLNAIVMEERQSIIKMDIDSLWRTSKLKKKVALKVEKIRERILCAFEEDSVRVDMDIRSFSISYLIRTIPLPAKLKESLRKIKLEIENEKNELAQAASDNKKYVYEYLAVIDDVMNAAVKVPVNDQYNPGGAVQGNKSKHYLINAEV